MPKKTLAKWPVWTRNGIVWSKSSQLLPHHFPAQKSFSGFPVRWDVLTKHVILLAFRWDTRFCQLSPTTFLQEDAATCKSVGCLVFAVFCCWTCLVKLCLHREHSIAYSVNFNSMSASKAGIQSPPPCTAVWASTSLLNLPSFSGQLDYTLPSPLSFVRFYFAL